MIRCPISVFLVLIFLEFFFQSGCTSGNNAASPFVNPQSNGSAQHPYLTQWGNGSLNNPVGIAVNSAGTTVYVADENNNSIKAYSSTGTLYTQWFVSIPTGVSVDPKGYVYVTSADGNDIIEKFDYAGNLTNQGGGLGTGNGKFNGPIGMACSDTTLFVADTGNNLVQAVTFVAATPTPPAVAFGLGFVNQWNGSSGGGTSFNAPQELVLNSAGTTFYVADTGDSIIQVFSMTSGFVKKWGGVGINTGQFNKPQGIAIAPGSGNIYVADTQNNRIEGFDPNGNYIFVLGFLGSGVGGFKLPVGVAADSTGNIYVADAGNNLIQKFGP